LNLNQNLSQNGYFQILQNWCYLTAADIVVWGFAAAIRLDENVVGSQRFSHG